MSIRLYIPPAKLSLTGPTFELGGAPRFVVYLAKMLQGALMAVVFAVPFYVLFGLEGVSAHESVIVIAWSCAVVAIVEKVQGLVDNAPGYNGAINPCDWMCDLALMMTWTLFFAVPWRAWGWAMIVVAAFLFTWPWSQE